MSFLRELKRRSVFRVSAAYVVASWLIIQVVSAIRDPLNLPDWFETVVVVLLAIGFLVAVILAWAFELTPDGIKATSAAREPAGKTGGGMLDYFLVGGLAVVAAATIWGQLPSAQISERPSVNGIEKTQSIAVLPFADMSPNGDQAYFGDGIAEELLNELSRMDGLYVASRTSSFSYRQSGENLRTIGDALDVTSVLEGSVRKDGNRIRVTAQLINVSDDRHLWSETFNRDLDDIFLIQREIAEAVSAELGVRLGVGNVNSFPGAGTRSVEAYELYLRAVQPTSNLPYENRIQILEQALQLDPNYAAASAALGFTIGGTMWSSLPEEAPALLDRATPYLQRAIEFDPNSAYAHTLLATISYPKMDWIGGERSYAAALSIRVNPDTLGHHANMLMRTGRSEAALVRYSEADTFAHSTPDPDPLRLFAYLGQNRIAEAKAMAREFGPPDSDSIRLLVALNEGDSVEVKSAIRALPPGKISTISLYSPLLDAFDSTDSALSVLQSVYADTNILWPSKYHDIGLLAAYFGNPEFSLELISNEVPYTPIRFGALWIPLMSEVRQLPEFKKLVTDVNLVEYWRTYGWADHCRPMGDEDFACD